MRVVGKFRGQQPLRRPARRAASAARDWVIKDDVYAVWVTGKKPKGSGWELDAGLKRDTGKWIEVVGRAETRSGVTYMRAVRSALTSPPTPTAEAQPPPPPPERPKVPPVVVFALPLDGDAEVPPDSRFVVQFSKDMDETTFEGRVLLRYAGPRLPGDRDVRRREAHLRPRPPRAHRGPGRRAPPAAASSSCCCCPASPTSTGCRSSRGRARTFDGSRRRPALPDRDLTAAATLVREVGS